MESVPDVICFSDVRWQSTMQRPQHLLSRCAKKYPVYYVEEPLFESSANRLSIVEHDGVTVVTPVISPRLPDDKKKFVQKALLTNFINSRRIIDYIAWYCTPTGVDWLILDESLFRIYDCRDELFQTPSVQLKEAERRLLKKADLVITSSLPLYEQKRRLHNAVFNLPQPPAFLFDSSIDSDIFEFSRTWDTAWKIISRLIRDGLEMKRAQQHSATAECGNIAVAQDQSLNFAQAGY